MPDMAHVLTEKFSDAWLHRVYQRLIGITLSLADAQNIVSRLMYLNQYFTTLDRLFRMQDTVSPG